MYGLATARQDLPADIPSPYAPGWDARVVLHSGGKDSKVAARNAVRAAEEAGERDKLIFVHNDLGRVEFPGTAALDAVHGDYYRQRFGATLTELFGDRPSAREMAERDAAYYGVPFLVRSRDKGDLLSQIIERGKFPDAANRYCTSDHKRGPKHKLFTALVDLADLGRKARILEVSGERAEESQARARKPELEYNQAASNKTKRDVFTWRSVHTWTLEDVWACHRDEDLEWHWAYNVMTRLSCSLCVLAAVDDVTWGCAMRPDLAQLYLDAEQQIGHLFRNRRSIGWFIDRAAGLGADQLAARMAAHAAVRAGTGPAVAGCPEALFELGGAL